MLKNSVPGWMSSWTLPPAPSRPCQCFRFPRRRIGNRRGTVGFLSCLILMGE